jgi:Ca-activated chloride channel family protein
LGGGLEVDGSMFFSLRRRLVMKRLIILSFLAVILINTSVNADGFIIPHPLAAGKPLPPRVSVKYHHVDVSIHGQLARTSVDQVFLNNYHHDIEGTYIFPIHPRASISDFSLFVGGEELKGKILERDEARRIYREIVNRRRDPALLEYFKDGMFKASVYPIPAKGEIGVKLYYSELMELNGGIYRYRYTLGTEKFSRDPLQSVRVDVTIKSDKEIKSIYSPTHDIRVERMDDHKARVSYVDENTRPRKDFLLYYTVSPEEIGFDLLAFEDEDQQGYFLAMVSPQVEFHKERSCKKNIVFILDTSGSMKGMKIKQARGALTFCLKSLNPKDRFNVIDFDDRITIFQPGLVSPDEKNISQALSFVEHCEAEGGTNINDAILSGLSQIGEEDGANFIIFLTDGLPTVGETDIHNIIKNIKNANSTGARLFVFGVGYDVNTKLLDRLAQDNHAVSDYVSPSENIEVSVSNFYRKVSHPILTGVQLDFKDIEIDKVYPREFPDIFEGTQLVVVGKYKGNEEKQVLLTGSSQGKIREYVYRVNFSSLRDNSHIPRLWATRRIGYLIDQLRLHGENTELVEEVVRLSKRFGIITEYTSFLVDEDHGRPMEELYRVARTRMRDSFREKVGSGAVKRAKATMAIKKAVTVPTSFSDREGREHKISRIIQVGSRSFYYRNGVWVDSEFGDEENVVKIKRFSEAYFKILILVPQAGNYFALGDDVIFFINGRAIRIGDEGRTDLSDSEFDSLLGDG